jgi:hypothetical protein
MGGVELRDGRDRRRCRIRLAPQGHPAAPRRSLPGVLAETAHRLKAITSPLPMCTLRPCRGHGLRLGPLQEAYAPGDPILRLPPGIG